MTAGELLLVLAASSAGMVVKSIYGLGYPLIFIPVVAAATGIENAVVVVTLPNLISNVLLCAQTRHALHESRDLATLAATGVVGAALGTLVLVSAPEGPLVMLVVASVAIFAARVLWFRDLWVSASAARRATPAVGAAVGLIQGSIGIPGPMLASWLHACRLERDAYILSMAAMFLVSGVSQALTQLAVGAFSAQRLSAAAVACLPVVTLTPVGARLRRRLSRRAFDTTLLAVLVAAAAVLVVRVAA